MRYCIGFDQRILWIVSPLAKNQGFRLQLLFDMKLSIFNLLGLNEWTNFAMKILLSQINFSYAWRTLGLFNQREILLDCKHIMRFLKRLRLLLLLLLLILPCFDSPFSCCLTLFQQFLYIKDISRAWLGLETFLISLPLVLCHSISWVLLARLQIHGAASVFCCHIEFGSQLIR